MAAIAIDNRWKRRTESRTQMWPRRWSAGAAFRAARLSLAAVAPLAQSGSGRLLVFVLFPVFCECIWTASDFRPKWRLRLEELYFFLRWKPLEMLLLVLALGGFRLVSLSVSASRGGSLRSSVQARFRSACIWSLRPCLSKN